MVVCWLILHRNRDFGPGGTLAAVQPDPRGWETPTAASPTPARIPTAAETGTTWQNAEDDPT